MFLDGRTPPPSTTLLRTRVKWENLLIAFVVLCFAAIGVTALVVSGQHDGTSPTTPHVEPATTLPEQSDASATTSLTIEDATGLVEEARQLMDAARWDEATDRLDSVPLDLRDDSGADALANELATTRATWEKLRLQLTAAVEAHQWKDADTLLDRLAQIATFDDDLRATRATVDEALAAPPTAATKTPQATTPAPKPQSHAAAASTPRPTSTPNATGTPVHASKPSATTPPANAVNTTPNNANAGANAGANAQDLLGQLTPDQQAQLDAALNALGNVG